MRKLCIRTLRRGVGSMDFMQGLLIMEDDLDEGHEEDESDVTPTPSTSTDLSCSSNAGTPDPAPSPSKNAIPWCKCGVCQIMPQEIEINVVVYDTVLQRTQQQLQIIKSIFSMEPTCNSVLKSSLEPKVYVTVSSFLAIPQLKFAL